MTETTSTNPDLPPPPQAIPTSEWIPFRVVDAAAYLDRPDPIYIDEAEDE